jgi:hypothetical protein
MFGCAPKASASVQDASIQLDFSKS